MRLLNSGSNNRTWMYYAMEKGFKLLGLSSF
jgi:hypothetical protein